MLITSRRFGYSTNVHLDSHTRVQKYKYNIITYTFSIIILKPVENRQKNVRGFICYDEIPPKELDHSG